MDPVWASFFGSALGGSVVSGLVTWLIHQSSGKREHQIWLRQLRYEFYMKQLGAMEELRSMAVRNPHGLHDPRTEVLTDQLVGTGIEVLAPPKVDKAYADVVESVIALLKADVPDDEGKTLAERGIPEVRAFSEAIRLFADSVREELGIAPWSKLVAKGWKP